MDPLEREQREIERRRARYVDRAKRVLHAKTRIIGVRLRALLPAAHVSPVQIDKDALDAQTEEKRQRDNLDKDRDRAYGEPDSLSFLALTAVVADDITLRHSQMVTDQVVQMELDKRRRATELQFFRKEQEREKRLSDLAGKV